MQTLELSWLRWNAGELQNVVEAVLARKSAMLEGVIGISEQERTFENTIAALARAGDELADLQQRLEFLLAVHPDAAFREIAQKSSHQIEGADVIMEYDRRLWAAVVEWQKRNEQLDAVDAKLAEDTIRDMRRMGFELKDDDFRQLKVIVTDLKNLATAFEVAINEWEDGIVVARDQLAGLPERYISGLARDGDGYRVTLAYPDYFPFMRMAHDGVARRELATKNWQKGGRENLERLARILELRQAHARLLGYATHADYVTEVRMAKSGAAATAFIEGILTKLQSASRSEFIDLIEIKKKQLHLEKRSPIQFYEMGYFSYQLLQERYSLDEEKVKEYFPLLVVVDRMLAMYQEVLGLQFTRITNASLWHEDAVLYEVTNEGSLCGHFALDLHPRSGKYGHAAAFPVTLGRVDDAGAQLHGFIALVCNFPKSTPDAPSLLSHEEVETLLHEFGHVIHALLSSGRWQRQNGFGVALDFVEAPSQLFEEWAWDARVLSRLSAHYKTGESMPESMLASLLAARYHMNATQYLQQATHALYDLQIHSLPTDTIQAPQALADTYRALKLQHETIELPDSSLFPAGWGHMSDYDAGYYGYLWSKVYALDLFSRFQSDPLNVVIGKQLKTRLLAPGASRDELTLVRDFLGREPSSEAFLASLMSRG